MTTDFAQPAGPGPICFDSMCLSGFAGADRLDVLRDLLVGWECWTTSVVRSELSDGVAAHPHLARALEVDWMRVATLDSLAELQAFVKWTRWLGAGEHGLGEASVLAAAELRHGIAITDDRGAVKVARKHGAQVHGTLWLIAQFCRAGKLTEPSAGRLVDALRADGMRLPCSGDGFPAFARQHGLL
ncbi:hypothetical protein [Dactylosporangium sp. CA-092794]|uniref:hypothetical protein n=1 Tax=Dactylosporangium sp. CA-092794 TaxID=3239929 RepID=UPI003D8CBD5F